MKKTGQIGNITGICMISTAVFVDLIQAFFLFILIGPFINWLVGFFALLTFWLWFTLNGVKFTRNPKNFFVFGGGSILEIIPVLASLPAWTLTVTSLVLMNKLKVVTEKITKKDKSDNVVNLADYREDNQKYKNAA
jgi:hypothetical protein